MGWEKKPVHRQKHIPWYDSQTVCRITFWLLFPILLLGITGLFEALKTDNWRQNIWMPAAMSLTSGWLMLRMALRVIFRKDEEDYR
ncbi:hypothetical protein LZ24_02742 [Desulfobotulus alkaliphilus]|uniref:Uncharacterized protein n=1 Tax=Desulfobotulus alkaliphilus TaxID=622671 RepID=A0A562RFY7_9BACT|nr:hypothetical protein [Desulfobotulus alkaliphilus]TWI67813.1 hypothetical protein LZ24_02742 [Desulfobotulus alkaliphilus]